MSGTLMVAGAGAISGGSWLIHWAKKERKPRFRIKRIVRDRFFLTYYRYSINYKVQILTPFGVWRTLQTVTNTSDDRNSFHDYRVDQCKAWLKKYISQDHSVNRLKVILDTKFDDIDKL